MTIEKALSTIKITKMVRLEIENGDTFRIISQGKTVPDVVLTPKLYSGLYEAVHYPAQENIVNSISRYLKKMKLRI